MKKKTNFMQKLISLFGIGNVRANAKSLKGKLLVEADRDENNRQIYVHHFKHTPLKGAIIRDGKNRFKVIESLDEDGNTLMTKYKVR